jgi:uncharacterized protein with HEPN domain
VKKSERTFRHFLEDIFDSISKILIYTKSYDFDTFRKDKRTVDAVIRNLELLVKLQIRYLSELERNIQTFPGTKCTG